MHVATPRPFVVLPVIGAIIAGLAIVFHEVTDKGIDTVLFSGQEALGPLIQNADSWSLGALAFPDGSWIRFLD